MQEYKSAHFNPGSYIIKVERYENQKHLIDDIAKNKKILLSDLLIVDEKSASIKIEQIRELKKRMSLKPKGGYNLAIICQAENMTTEASNTMLKLLEDYSKYKIIVLIVKNVYKLLPTIRSRCQKINFIDIAEKETAQGNLEILFKIAKCATIAEKFALISEIVKTEIDIKQLIVDWTNYFRNNINGKNINNLKVLDKFGRVYSSGINKKLYLENLALLINL